MNSSTSSSDAASWRRFATTLLATAAVVVAGLIAMAYAVDPYDSGRSSLFAKLGVRPQGPRTANASRGRDQTFDAAIVGNSRIQLISPERLKNATGLDFVQLSVPGSGPKEQLTLIDWFLRHRKEPPKALLVSIDDTWCTADPELPNDKPFPFWLYSTSSLGYAKGLLRYDVLEELPQRLSYLLEATPMRARPDGYWDYENEHISENADAKRSYRQEMAQKPFANAPIFNRDPQEGRRAFPAAVRLKGIAASLPADAALILVIPPVYHNLLPPPGTEQAYRLQACKAALSTAAQEAHAKTAVVDWRTDRSEARDPDQFFDRIHYRQPIARAMETDIAEAYRQLQ